MNHVAMTVINPRKEYWPSRGSSQPPPVLKTCKLPTELLCSAYPFGTNWEKYTGHYFFLLSAQMCSKLFSVRIVNSLSNDKVLDWSKLKAFADDKINVNVKLKLGLERVESIVGKGENAGYQHFLLFPQCIQKASFSMSLKVGIVW